MSGAYQLSLCAILAALALILSYVETLIPFNFGIPGIKIGLANLIIIIALYDMDVRYAAIINIIRIFLAGFMFTGLGSIFFSFTGGMLSLLVMWLLKKTGKFSMIGVSMAGGAAHNFGQLIVAAITVSNIQMFLYFPVLLIAGMITGICIGIVAYIFDSRLPSKYRLHPENRSISPEDTEEENE
ncbi:MAG: Gx transporter family protein [Anaerovoracaceae bacterium]|jgi:heptaprenyl diphosphate synthase